jgi:prepilin-type N-terminal cleavage/methylation domain-containing protein/prepilin-type processing-associated H-X9-DG protein
MTSLKRHRSSGFTLLELLVVIAIIAILISLLVPAVQRVREASSRTYCTNNMKNIGLALHNFAGTHKAFPPGAVDTYPPFPPFPALGVPANTSHGWVPFILPYVEQQALAKDYRLDLDFRHPTNGPVITHVLPILLCPSTPVGPNRLDTFTSGGFVGWQAACTDYGAVRGVQSTLATQPPFLVDAVENYDGVMKENFMTRLADITDGTSNTLVITEDAGRPMLFKWGSLAGSPPGARTSGAGWADVDNRFTLNGAPPSSAVTVKSCPMNCTNDNEPYSFHSGGANCLFADGSIHFIRAGIDIRVFARLITRAGGETAGIGD